MIYALKLKTDSPNLQLGYTVYYAGPDFDFIFRSCKIYCVGQIAIFDQMCHLDNFWEKLPPLARGC